ncbi:hypothetical protein SDRG_05065 [Saprolegnia diclina VS20]|uniref:Uncharacterized protein n=1 Tax=Saprolegnia diclina (strain VS20) TaxID=1156394 RepID=T0S477_SAPDV|nr:hypothetical protein SDRG_05065 [Saprolegnia diclina VS20]EQC37462.1 hypothetical protein SDRG_05065 [Saprolegnia diclina VS20]|eukprot:XP_008608982.1 hypothetical protein SDRG_05065 [Saprolegnia diclina VS20]
MTTCGADTSRGSRLPLLRADDASSVVARVRRIQSAFKNHPETLCEATRGEFNPTTLECAIHKLVVNESLVHLHPLHWWLHADALYLYPYKISPALLAAFFHFDFGPHRLSIMHFKPHEQPELDAWHNTLRAAPSSEGLPVPPTPSSLDDIEEALAGLSHIVGTYGSQALQTLVYTAQFAVLSLVREFRDVKSWDLPAFIRFLDEKMHAFRAAVVADVLATPATAKHTIVHEQLKRRSAAMGLFVSELLLGRPMPVANATSTELPTMPAGTKRKPTSRKSNKKTKNKTANMFTTYAKCMYEDVMGR